jgi:hypothetical protein
MSRRMLNAAGALALVLTLTCAAFAQQTQTTTTVTTQKTEAVQNADGTWTVIEYPADKEVVVNLTPTDMLPTATGTAKIMRMKDHTMINLNAAGLTNVNGLNLYAVDPWGKVTMIGPVNVNNGVATQTFTTPLDKFMLVLSPEGNLTTFAPETKVAFRSAVPQGFAVVPLAHSGPNEGAPIGERVVATSTAGASTSYRVPMLGISGMKRGEDTTVKVNFAGALTGARANINVEPRKDGPTMVKARFHELKEAPAGQVYVLWAVSPDNKYVKLGQIVNTGGRNEAEIRSETMLPDFGLLVTLEEAHDIPTGPVVGTIVLR